LVIEAGANALAVISAIFSVDNVESTTQQFSQLYIS